MKLTEYEKSILAGDFGEEASKTLEVMVKVYEIQNAKEFVEVKEVLLASTQNMMVAGVLGMEFLTRLADSGIRFKARTITDPVSIDLERWKRLGIPEDYAEKQQRSVAALVKMGAVPTWTCTPYLSGSIPRCGDHLAYVETSCVSFANSYFGARTNREVDLSALAAAITGKTPSYGLHLLENREGQLRVDVEAELKSVSDYDALGIYIGRVSETRVPVIRFRRLGGEIPLQGLMQMAASVATSGAVALFHIDGVTPEMVMYPERYGGQRIAEEVRVTGEEMRRVYEELNTARSREVDFVSVGCPHYTFDKLREIAGYMEGKRVKRGMEVWVCTSQTVRNMGLRSGEVEAIEKAGAKVVVDTCMVLLSPLYKQMGIRTMATDSGKAQFYVSGLGIGVRFGDTRRCLEAAVTGRWEE